MRPTVRTPKLKKLLSEMNSAPSDQKISAIVTLLNKLVEQRTAAPVQAQQTPAPRDWHVHVL
jgi:hypothetical protein